MLSRSMGRLLELFEWEPPQTPRMEWGFHEEAPFEWEVEFLNLFEENGHWYAEEYASETIHGIPYSSILYWYYGDEPLGSVQDITQTCGDKRCANPRHLTHRDKLERPDTTRKEKTPFNYVQGPPVVKSRKGKRRITPGSEETRESRLKCISRKAWFPDSGTAASKESGMRPYKCNMCDGWHLTHKPRVGKKVVRNRNRKMPYS